MAKRPRCCPNCNAPRVAKIFYGYPMFDDKLEKDISEGKIVLGGCMHADNAPDYKCVECEALLFCKTGKFTINKEDEF